MLRTATKLLTFLAITIATTQVQSAVVFSEDFDAENGGNTALNYTGFANFNSLGGGNVDLIGNSNGFGITCPAGSCVDLDGSPGPASLQSIADFAFNAGDMIRLSFDISGNQRVAGQLDDYFVGLSFDSNLNMVDLGLNDGSGDSIVSAFQTASSLSFGFPSIFGNEGFAQRSVFLTASQAGSLRFQIGTEGNDNVGVILDNIALDISGVPSGVPEPGTMGLLGLGLVALMVRRRQHS